MLILDSTVRSLEIDLAGAVTTNQLPFVAAWVDHTSTAYTPGTTTGQSNNTTAVTIVAAPAASTQRSIKYLNIKNSDTVSAVVTIQYNDNGTLRELIEVTLSVEDTLQYVDTDGWSVLNTSGQKKSLASISGNVTVIQPTGTNLHAVIDGTVAVTQSGTWDEVGINDSGNSITVDAPVGTPVAVRLSDGTAFLTTASGRLSVDASGVAVPVTDNGGSLTVDGTVSVSGTVDTELPTAETPADNLTNATAAPRVNSLGYVFDGTTWDRLPGNSTDGALVNLGTNNDVTVTSGTITANAGTNLNTSALALETTQGTGNTRIGDLTETAPATDTASSGLNGRLQRVAQRLTSLIALLPSALVSGRLDVNIGAAPATLTCDNTELPATVTLADNTTNPSVSAIAGFNMVFDGTTWDRAPGTSVDGALVNLGANNDITVTSGTITSVTQFNGQAIQMGSGVRTAGTQRVTVATDDIVPASQSGTWTVQPGNTANTTPWLVGHGKTIKSVSGSLTADTTAIAAVSTKRLKVIGYTLTSSGTSATTLLFKTNNAAGAELWRVFLQSAASLSSGANLATSAPSFLFASVAGEALFIDVNTTDTIHYSISYFDDDTA